MACCSVKASGCASLAAAPAAFVAQPFAHDLRHVNFVGDAEPDNAAFTLGPHAMSHQRILVIQGHPDAAEPHFGHALSSAYAEGAMKAGHEVRTLTLASLEFPLLRSKRDWDTEAAPASLGPAQQDILWAQHLVLFFPLWLGGMPAMVKAFLEQVARPGFALSRLDAGKLPEKLLKGRSARVVVTMGMPALVYKWYFRAHSVKALERNILGFVGIAPVHETLIGMVEGMSESDHAKWMEKLRSLGAKAA